MKHFKNIVSNLKIRSTKHLCQRHFFDKVASLRRATLLKKSLWHRFFPVNFSKFLRTHFFTEHLRWLLLKIFENTFIINDNLDNISHSVDKAILPKYSTFKKTWNTGNFSFQPADNWQGERNQRYRP